MFNRVSFSCVRMEHFTVALNRIKSKSVGADGIPMGFFFNNLFMCMWHCFGFGKFCFDVVSFSLFVKASSCRSQAISMKDQIVTHVASRIYNGQFAFRRNHNATIKLLNLTDLVKNNSNLNNNTESFSLGLTRVFNYTFHPLLLKKVIC